LSKPELTVDELMEIIPAPDFPTAGIIYGLEGVREGYRTGRGRVVMRARTHVEDLDRGSRQAIIVDEIPYQVNKANLLTRIGELVREKKLEGISDLRDESDKSGMRVVIERERGDGADARARARGLARAPGTYHAHKGRDAAESVQRHGNHMGHMRKQIKEQEKSSDAHGPMVKRNE